MFTSTKTLFPSGPRLHRLPHHHRRHLMNRCAFHRLPVSHNSGARRCLSWTCRPLPRPPQEHLQPRRPVQRFARIREHPQHLLCRHLRRPRHPLQRHLRGLHTTGRRRHLCRPRRPPRRHLQELSTTGRNRRRPRCPRRPERFLLPRLPRLPHRLRLQCRHHQHTLQHHRPSAPPLPRRRPLHHHRLHHNIRW